GMTAEEVGARLEVDPRSGLTADQVARRSAAAGPNAIRPYERESVFAMLVEAVTEPFVILLAIAGGLAIVLGEVRDGLLILIGLVPIVGADLVTGFRAERALEALRDATAPRARVRRALIVADVPATE